MLMFRRIAEQEFQLIKNSLIKFGNWRNFESMITPENLVIAEGKWKEVFIVSEHVLEVFELIRKIRNPYFLGLHLGDIKKRSFRISLEGITLISEYSEKKTVLTQSGEKKVLYGRDLNIADVRIVPKGIRKGDLSILINKEEEALALGKYLFKGDEMQKLDNKQKVIKNIVDKGWYLRKGK